MPNILIAHEDGENLKITGMVDVSDDLKELIGTSTERPDIVLEKSAGANLEQALVNGLRSAHEVLGGYVKFAKPIVVKGVVPPYVTEKLAGISKTDTTNVVVGETGHLVPEKRAFVTLNPDFVTELSDLVTKIEAGTLEKSASCPFVDRWISHMEDMKVDGDAVEISAPCKVSFATNAARDFFLGLFDGPQKKAHSMSIDDLASSLVSGGLVKGGVVERLASAGVKKHAQQSTTRRKK